jgi:hypothetical protein
MAVLVAVIAINWAGQTAAHLWRESLDKRLLDAGAGTNVDAIGLEREQLKAFRAIAFADGFPQELANYDARAIEQRLTPIDANHGMPMIDIIDDQGRVVFAFRAQGAIRPIYRQRKDLEIVQKALRGEFDEFGERFNDIITTDEGPLVATAGPVRVGTRIVGALLVMTPLETLLSTSTNLHGALLTAYSLDRGDPMATTTPIRPRTIDTDLRTRLSHPEELPYANRLNVGGRPHREQIAGLVLHHHTAALLGVALPDRSRHVANQVMLVVALGMLLIAVVVASVVHAWTRDRYERGLAPLGRRPVEPLALPPGKDDQ